jgi:hypothetical protein
MLDIIVVLNFITEKTILKKYFYRLLDVFLVPCVVTKREYWIIYRGPGFLAVPPPHLPLSQFELWHLGRPRKRDNLLTGEGGKGWRRSQIIRRRESLVLSKSFNILWSQVYLQSKVRKRKTQDAKKTKWKKSPPSRWRILCVWRW